MVLYSYVNVKFQNFDVSKIVNEKGCIEAAEEWIEFNMISLTWHVIFIFFGQVGYNLFLFDIYLMLLL